MRSMISWDPGLGTVKGRDRIFWSDENVLYNDCGGYTGMYTVVKIQTIHLEWVYFNVCKLYLYKVHLKTKQNQ